MLAFIILFSVILAVGTLLVGMVPPEKTYGAKTRKNWMRLLIFYGISTVVFLAILYLFRSDTQV